MSTSHPSNTRLFVYLILVLGGGLRSYVWMTAPVDEDRALMGYVRRVTNSVNPYVLQEWAVVMLKRSGAELASANAQTPRVTEVPDLVRRIPTLGFAPAQVALCRSGPEVAGTPFISIYHLGGFGSWGTCVGDMNFRLVDDRHTYEWIPGVYIRISP